MSVFNINNKTNHTQALAFLDPSGPCTLQRYETLKYKQFDKLTDKQLGFFWRPEEVDVLRDAKDFKELTDFEQHIFTSNLKRQILLDSVQGRSPNLAFLPLASIPELETWIETWAFNETIHSRSYTHIIRNVFSNPSQVFDELTDIEEIINCAKDISKYYDDCIEAGRWYQTLGAGTHTVNGKEIVVDIYDLKRKLWLAINSVNALEGIRFYVSFACSWAFAELKKMEGNAKIIKLIARDENLHLAFTQSLIKILPGDDPDFAKLKEETREQCEAMFLQAAEQEKEWAKYLFKDGSMIGLNQVLLAQYVDWLTCKRMTAVGLDCGIKPGSNPLPWTQKWIAGSDVQVAPQETEISSYVIGGTKQDVNEHTFKGFSL
ncbi:NrdF Ribonucleotide reductase, beta subunit [uncultured Caudovirales phage]|uniref:ribonucleoside-diphosphate reductase n=1 Tax=uncultured Caudovirales phage TaxID=2100421 RepID=A0A6J5L8V3_9CAUD|nr:NrdF Ribonucleotide reductase, beta subunit [uncultured Caudovirales phage]